MNNKIFENKIKEIFKSLEEFDYEDRIYILKSAYSLMIDEYYYEETK